MRSDTSTRKLIKGTTVYRYYFDYSTASRAISGIQARRVRAQPLEDAVVGAVFEVLQDRKWIAERVRAQMENMGSGEGDVEKQREKLVEEREQVTLRLKRIHKTSKNLTDEELEGLVAEDNARLVAIRREVADLEHSDEQKPLTPKDAIAAVTARLSSVPERWQDLPRVELKRFLAAVVEDLQIDLHTLETTFTIRMPQWAVTPVSKDNRSVRLNFTSAWSSVAETNAVPAITLDRIHCRAERKCYFCSRRKRAA
jgi:hypothetical protein